MNEITALTRASAVDGSVQWQVGLWFDISATPVTDGKGAPVAPQTSAAIDPDHARYLSAEQKTAVSAGTAGVFYMAVQQLPGETEGALLTRIVAAYPTIKANWLARQGLIHARQGFQASV